MKDGKPLPTVTDRTMIPRLRAGDHSVKDKIIIELIPLARIAASKYARLFKEKQADIYAQAMLGLVQAVAWASEGRLKDDNIEPYVWVTVKRFVFDLIRQDHVIVVPAYVRESFLKELKKEEPSLNRFERRERFEELLKKYIVTTGILDKLNDDDETIQDALLVEDDDIPGLRELYRMLTLSKREAIVLEYLIQGFTLREICTLTAKSLGSITYSINKIREKYRLIQVRNPGVLKGPNEQGTVVQE